MLRDMLPGLETCYLGQSVLIQGVSGCTTVPLAKVYLNSDLATGYFTVGVQDSLPVEGVNFLMGNDIAGGKVVPDPIVTSSPSPSNNTEQLEKEYPHLFPSCVVTRSMAAQQSTPNNGDIDDTDSMVGDISALFF